MDKKRTLFGAKIENGHLMAMQVGWILPDRSTNFIRFAPIKQMKYCCRGQALRNIRTIFFVIWLVNHWSNWINLLFVSKLCHTEVLKCPTHFGDVPNGNSTRYRFASPIEFHFSQWYGAVLFSLAILLCCCWFVGKRRSLGHEDTGMTAIYELLKHVKWRTVVCDARGFHTIDS